ncbi:MAG: electron transfer flavoprotein subunit alpha/FixB family protein [Dehalococcoidia bacterium]|nr:electron transfer flavoprotein subunit alpha/FixB family protein [Dehalococcoidia bacterium]
MAEDKGLLTIGEVANGKLAPIAAELLGIGRKLADARGDKLDMLLLGANLAEAAKQAIAYGADRVYVAENPALAEYNPDSYAAAATKVAKQLSPSILLMGQTDMGRDLAPRLAAKLGGAVSMDCTELAIEPDTKLLLATRPVFGGNANGVMRVKARPQMATIRAKSMAALEPNASRQGEVIKVDAGVDASAVKVKVTKKVKQEALGIKLEDAEFVVTGGRGMGGAEAFKSLEELARVLGGAVGATRAACDDGWVASTIQVGQTGKIVSPKLYIAVGVSGAMQHIAGCSGSKNIVAINKDPEANIFKVAHFGVVGDYKEALPAFIQKCKELLAT